MRIEVNDLSFHVMDEGQGPPVLLLHGFPDSSHLWRRQIPVLTRAGYRVIAPDLRGFGESDRPGSVEDYALPVVIGDLIGILDTLDVEQATVVGHDWGAVLAWTLAAMIPDRVERLVALTVGHPNGFFADPIGQRRLSWYVLFFLFPGIAEKALRRDDWALFRTFLGDAPDLDRYIRDLERPDALTAGLNWYRANFSPEMFGQDNPTPLPPVGCPVMGIWASGDVALGEAQMLASSKHVTGPWRYERLDGVGHWIPLEAPDRLNRLLTDFITASSPA
jgi:pimeloyl-ACP methyl ester carboxylesterase